MGRLVVLLLLLATPAWGFDSDSSGSLWDTYDQIIEQNHREQQNQTITGMQREEPWRFQELERLRPQPEQPNLRLKVSPHNSKQISLWLTPHFRARVLLMPVTGRFPRTPTSASCGGCHSFSP